MVSWGTRTPERSWLLYVGSEMLCKFPRRQTPAPLSARGVELQHIKYKLGLGDSEENCSPCDMLTLNTIILQIHTRPSSRVRESGESRDTWKLCKSQKVELQREKSKTPLHPTPVRLTYKANHGHISYEHHIPAFEGLRLWNLLLLSW